MAKGDMDFKKLILASSVCQGMAEKIDAIKAERTAECLAECSRVRKEEYVIRQRGGYLR